MEVSRRNHATCLEHANIVCGLLDSVLGIVAGIVVIIVIIVSIWHTSRARFLCIGRPR